MSLTIHHAELFIRRLLLLCYCYSYGLYMLCAAAIAVMLAVCAAATAAPFVTVRDPEIENVWSNSNSISGEKQLACIVAADANNSSLRTNTQHVYLLHLWKLSDTPRFCISCVFFFFGSLFILCISICAVNRARCKYLQFTCIFCCCWSALWKLFEMRNENGLSVLFAIFFCFVLHFTAFCGCCCCRCHRRCCCCCYIIVI